MRDVPCDPTCLSSRCFECLSRVCHVTSCVLRLMTSCPAPPSPSPCSHSPSPLSSRHSTLASRLSLSFPSFLLHPPSSTSILFRLLLINLLNTLILLNLILFLFLNPGRRCPSSWASSLGTPRRMPQTDRPAPPTLTLPDPPSPSRPHRLTSGVCLFGAVRSVSVRPETQIGANVESRLFLQCVVFGWCGVRVHEGALPMLSLG